MTGIYEMIASATNIHPQLRNLFALVKYEGAVCDHGARGECALCRSDCVSCGAKWTKQGAGPAKHLPVNHFFCNIEERLYCRECGADAHQFEESDLERYRR